MDHVKLALILVLSTYFSEIITTLVHEMSFFLKKLQVSSDEIYEHIIYQPTKHTFILSIS
jgi:aspartate/methionine/tyrosine aminotransferase